MSKKIKNKLKERLTLQLPGWATQKIMSPFKTERYLDLNKAGKKAAVLALLYPDNSDKLHLIFIKRSSNNPHDKHGGQISFPGGQQEAQDKDFEATALRETFEEVGVKSSKIEILGQLTPIYVYVSDFFVQPFLGITHQKPEFILQASEVDHIIVESIDYLKSDASNATTDYNIRDGIMKNMPYYKVDNHILWGATAMITAEIIQIFNEIY